MGNKPSHAFSMSYMKAGPAFFRFPELKTIPDYIRHYSETQPDKEAFVFVSTDGSRDAVTWKQLYDNSKNVGKSLVAMGVKEHEFVAVCVRNCPQWLYIAYGTMFAGARMIAISFTYTDGSDVVGMMRKLRTCRCIVLDPGADGGNWRILSSLLDSCDKDGKATSSRMPYLRNVVCHGDSVATNGLLRLDDLIQRENDAVELPVIDETYMAALFQSSGSTGLPKAIAHTHKSYINAANQILCGPVDEDDIVLNVRPFTWIGGSPGNVIIGTKRVTRSGFCEEPKDRAKFLLDVIQREKCTTMLALPPVLKELIEHKDVLEGTTCVSSMKTVMTGGQPIRKEYAHCIGKFCKYFANIYGAAEYMVCTSSLDNNVEGFREFSAGYILDGVEIKVVDENEQIVTTNTIGELYIRFPGLFKEYFNDEVKTRAVFTDDGWYRSDDLVTMTHEGEIFVKGRKSDMMISGGMNVDPAVLETSIKTFQGLHDVCCVPVPHDTLHQVVCACVIVKKGNDVTEEQLRSYCESIHNDKPGLFTVLPEYYLFMATFPETSTGKTFRKELTAIALKKFRPENK